MGIERSWIGLLAGFGFVGAVAFAGCATGNSEFDDDDDAAAGAGGAGGGFDSPCGIDCSEIGAPECHVGICNADTLTCAVVPAEDGTECDDGLFCTDGDACVAGVCQPGRPNTCGITPESCQLVTCVESSQSCTTMTAPDGESCTPDDLCLTMTECLNGLCIGTPRNCQYGPVPSDCHVSECNPATGDCEPVVGNEGEECADPNDPCLVGGTCASGTCIGTSDKDCSDLTEPSTCTVGICNASGVCEAQTMGNGDSCDDLNGCTLNDTCQGGVCTPDTTITACGPSDGCCPTGGACGPVQDGDCPPFGALCPWPIDVTAATFPVVTTGDFTDDPQEGSTCDTLPTNAVWYSFTPATTANHQIDVSHAVSGSYARVAVFEGLGCTPYGGQLGCKNASTSSVSLTVPMYAAQPYLILFHTYSDSQAMSDPSIDIVAQPPPTMVGEDCILPALITSPNHSVDGSNHDCWTWTADSSNDTSDHRFSCDTGTGGDVVIEYTTGASQTTLNFDASGSDWDSSGYIAFEITPASCPTGTTLECQSSTGTQSHAGSITVTPSTTYYIWAGDGFSGNFLPSLDVCLW